MVQSVGMTAFDGTNIWVAKSGSPGSVSKLVP